MRKKSQAKEFTKSVCKKSQSKEFTKSEMTILGKFKN